MKRANGLAHGNGQLWQKVTFVAGDTDGPAEAYYENGQLVERGSYNREKGSYNFVGKKCGEWFEDGKTVTYDPCPPDLEDGN